MTIKCDDFFLTAKGCLNSKRPTKKSLLAHPKTSLQALLPGFEPNIFTWKENSSTTWPCAHFTLVDYNQSNTSMWCFQKPDRNAKMVPESGPKPIHAICAVQNARRDTRQGGESHKVRQRGAEIARWFWRGYFCSCVENCLSDRLDADRTCLEVHYDRGVEAGIRWCWANVFVGRVRRRANLPGSL